MQRGQVEPRGDVIRDGVVDLDQVRIAHADQRCIHIGVREHIVQQQLPYPLAIGLGKGLLHQPLEHAIGVHQPSTLSSVFASFRSAVSNPSVNHP
jgi:hypothetical protein